MCYQDFPEEAHRLTVDLTANQTGVCWVHLPANAECVKT